MAIQQITTANTFQHWLLATQGLITVANTLTDGNGASFFANTKLDISGTQAQLNVRTSAGINNLYANNAVIGGLFIENGNLNSINVSTTANIGGDVVISGNLTVSGNITLDALGFDDLIANGSIAAANNLTVGGFAIITGNTTLSNTTITYGNFQTSNVDSLVGNANTLIFNTIANANTAIYNSISAIDGSALAYAIALG